MEKITPRKLATETNSAETQGAETQGAGTQGAGTQGAGTQRLRDSGTHNGDWASRVTHSGFARQRCQVTVD